MLSSFENQMIMEKLDAINKSILKLEKRVKDLEDLNLNYLGLIEETNNTVKVLTGEVIQEMEKTEDDETLVAIVTFPDTYKKGGDLN
jgi:t-SNARE complex subunit (syntaxin)